MRALAALVIVVVVAACRSNDASPQSTAQDSGPPQDAGPTIAWAPCSLAVDVPGAAAIECATVEVPLEWSAPSGRTITLSIKRVRGSKSPSRQLWLLAGGPGVSARPFEVDVPALIARDPSLDVYLLDHRGTGASTLLTCTSFVDLAACATELSATYGTLDGFSTTNAAQDVGHLIDWTRAPGQPAFVYGLSYGTYWAQRYLLLFPSQASGVILDGVLPADGQLVGSDHPNQASWDDAFKRLMDACSADAFCASKLGADAYARVKPALDAADSACTVSSSLVIESMFNALLTPWQERVLIPAIVYRLARCTPADKVAIQSLKKAVGATPKPPTTTDDRALFVNILFSELWSDPSPTREELAAAEAASFVPQGFSFSWDDRSKWPRYHDVLVGQHATTALPMLMLNGTLDPRTGIDSAKRVASLYTGPNQRFFEVPNATHGVIFTSAFSPSTTDPAKPCGADMLFSFMDHPGEGADTSCIAKIPTVDFRGDAALAQRYFGTADIWD